VIDNPMGTSVAQRPDADAALAAVDDAMRAIGGRSVVTADEARQLLESITRSVAGTSDAEPVTRLAGDALDAIGESLLVERARLMDAMLDIRLAMTG
jgi:hypothetical protein